MMHRSCQSGLTNKKIFLERTFCTSKDFHRVEVENGLFDQNEENENGKISKDSTNWLRYEQPKEIIHSAFNQTNEGKDRVVIVLNIEITNWF